MKLKICVGIVFMLIAVSAGAQNRSYTGFPSLIWPKLYNIQFEKGKDKLGEFDKPVFSAGAKALGGKRVSLPGYMVPFETGTRGTHFMFSSMPLNACFFCGVGGPETVIEVFARSPVSFAEKPVEVSGVLKLNDTDPDQMIYVLEDAQILGPVEP
jgi:hypothetical protein